MSGWLYEKYGKKSTGVEAARAVIKEAVPVVDRNVVSGCFVCEERKRKARERVARCRARKKQA